MPNQNDPDLARTRARTAERLFVAGETFRAIAETIGVSKQRVHQIINLRPEADRLALYRKNHAARIEQRNRALYEKCTECGTGFINHTRGRKFCSKKCRTKAWQRMFKKGRGAPCTS